MSRRRALLAPLALAVAVGATYLGSLDGGFVSDDVVNIENNPLLRSLSPANLRAIATSFDDANWIPLKVLSLAIDQQIWGPAPFGYHLGNLVLHAAAAVLCWALGLRLGLSPVAAWLTALLWAVHPLQVESVAFMSERKNVLSTCFFLAAFLAWARFSATGRRRDWALVLLLFAGALLSKMNTAVLPVLCIAYDWVFGGRVTRRTAIGCAPLVLVGAIVVWINLAGSVVHAAAWHGGSAVVTWLSSSTVVPRYLAAVAYPADLRSYYFVPLRGSLADPAVALSVLLLALLVIIGAGLTLRRRREGFWLVWVGVTLAPMLNIVPFPTLMQDRYMYVPLLGVLALPIGMLDACLHGARLRLAAALAAAGLALAWGQATVRQIEVWHDERSLWTAWALVEWYLPSDAGGLRGPDSDAKLAILAEAVRAKPDALMPRHNLGALQLERGQFREALANLTAAAELDGEHGVVWLNLGRAHYRAGEPTAAVAALERAAALAPYAFYAHLNLARARIRTGDGAGARAALEAAARLRPGPAGQRLIEPELRRLPPTTSDGGALRAPPSAVRWSTWRLASRPAARLRSRRLPPAMACRPGRCSRSPGRRAAP